MWLMDLISSRFDFTVTAHFTLKAFWLLDSSLCQKVKLLTDEGSFLSPSDPLQGFHLSFLKSFT